jgi:hypothetical protein
MPWFYLDASVGDDFIRDDVGAEYESIGAAEYAATNVAAVIGHDRLPRYRSSEVCVKLRDERGLLLLTVEVLMTVRRTIHALA